MQPPPPHTQPFCSAKEAVVDVYSHKTVFIKKVLGLRAALLLPGVKQKGKFSADIC